MKDSFDLNNRDLNFGRSLTTGAQSDLERKGTNFINQLKSAMTTITADSNYRNMPIVDPKWYDQICVDEKTGNFAPEFRNELLNQKEILIEEINKIDQLCSSTDVFGNIRYQCEACVDSCMGYLSQGSVCPTLKGELDFQTFCMNCGCPGSFHTILEPKSGLAPSMSEYLREFNISPQELDFNAILAVFEIPNNGKTKLSHEIHEMIKREGLEILSSESRSFDIQEALYLRSRILSFQNQQISTITGTQSKQNNSQIRGPTSGQDIFTATVRNELLLLDQSQRRTEMVVRMNSSKILRDNGFQKPAKQTTNQSSRQQTVDDFSEYQFNEKDTESGVQKQPTLTISIADLDADLNKSSIAPRKMKQSLKVESRRNGWKPEGGNRFRRDETIQQQMDALITSILNNPDLADMLVNSYLIVVIGSTQTQQLGQVMDQRVRVKLKEVVGSKVRLFYMSRGKVDSLEDTLIFSPQLFKLQKSVVITEPTQGIFNQEAREELERSSMKTKLTLTLDQISDITFQNMNTFLSKTKLQTGTTRKLTQILKTQVQTLRGTTTSGGKIGRIQTTQEDKDLARDTQWVTSDKDKNHIYKNFGIMLDFFDFSGVRIQGSRRCVDLTTPAFLGFRFQPYERRAIVYKQLLSGVNLNRPQACNMFAISKVGTLNMIFPSTLDVNFKNIQNQQNYIEICDYFFPQNSQSQISVIVFKPIIVNNGLNDIFVEILRANNFLILKRKLKKLSRPEASFLCKIEKVAPQNIEIFLDSITEGACEIVVVSKVSAIQDARTICHGSISGRRRVQQMIGGTDPRKNVDSLSALFEISPFSSFNEIIDLRNFLIRHDKVQKYIVDSLSSSKQTEAISKLKLQKQEEIRLELDQFQRHFNFCAYSARNDEEALKMLSVLAPRVAVLEEVMIILNPFYNHLLWKAEELLVRMQYRFVSFGTKVLSTRQIEDLLEDKFDLNSINGSKLVQIFANQPLHFFHLTKVAGYKELVSIFEQSEANLDDHIYSSNQVSESPGSFLPDLIPFLFILMDSEKMMESAMEKFYDGHLVKFSGDEMVNKLRASQVEQILEMSLFISTGDPILKVVYDDKGDLVQPHQCVKKNRYKTIRLSGICEPSRFDIFNQDHFEKAQYRQLIPDPFSNYRPTRFVVEGYSRNLYEVKFLSISEFDQEWREGDEDGQSDKSRSPSPPKTTVETTFKKKVTFQDDTIPTQIIKSPVITKLAMELFEQFQAKNFYYQQVSMRLGGGIVPNFYRFKISPFSEQRLKRVFEIEEYMGRNIIEEAADMHINHQKLINHQKEAKSSSWRISLLVQSDNQKSLPAFMIGQQIAEMCKKLEQVVCKDSLSGAGKLVYSREKKQLRGEIRETKRYFKSDMERYQSMLEFIKPRWDNYISLLETEIIESKLLEILDSLTFKYSRLPEFLVLMPDKVYPSNLRMCPTFKLINDTINQQENEGLLLSTVDQLREASKEGEVRFFKDVYNDPNRACELKEKVQSVLHVLSKEQDKLYRDKFGPFLSAEQKYYQSMRDKESAKLDETIKKNYSIHKHVALAGVEVARRPKYQLVASILFLLDFWYRKVERRDDLLKLANISEDQAGKQYDQLLDDMVNGLKKNYGNDEVNHVLDLVKLKSGHDSLFHDVLKEKAERKQRHQLMKRQRQERINRKQRNDKDLMKKIQEDPQYKDNPQLQEQAYFKKLIELSKDDQTEKEQLSLLKSFIQSRFIDFSMTNTDNDLFTTILNNTKTKLGQHSQQMADDFILQTQMEHERVVKHKETVQEKISFVKMEYFLYGFDEAYRLMKKLAEFRSEMRQTRQEIEKNQKLIEEQASMVASKQVQMKVSGNKYLEQGMEEIARNIKSIQESNQEKETAINRIRFRMATFETQLLLVLRELISFNIKVPDTYFVGDRLVKDQNDGIAADPVVQLYSVPIKTFWIPIIAEDYQIDPSSREALKYKTKPEEVTIHNRGQFLAPSIKQHIQENPAEEEKKRKRNQMNAPINLREVKKDDRPKEIIFDKFVNPSFQREAEELQKITATLNRQTLTDIPAIDFQNDPFAKIRNKEAALETINETVNVYLMRNTALMQDSGLTLDHCKILTLQTMERMKARNLKFEEFSDDNFHTSFNVYADGVSGKVEKSQLKAFLKSVAEV